MKGDFVKMEHAAPVEFDPRPLCGDGRYVLGVYVPGAVVLTLMGRLAFCEIKLSIHTK